MDEREKPIGFFDSGVGGLSVLLHAVKELKNENFIYYGDDKNAPYGEKSEEEIKELTIQCGQFLYGKGVKAIVMACNTATSIAVQRMREIFQIPVVSIEPAVKPACEANAQGKILVMATPATILQKRYNNLVDRLGCRDRVVNLPCDGLAQLLESGDFAQPAIEDYLRRKFAPIEGETIAGIVIGCTHYSFITGKIQAVAQELFQGDCAIYDGMYGMVRQLGVVLRENGLDSPGPGGEISLYSSGGDRMIRIFEKVIRQNRG